MAGDCPIPECLPADTCVRNLPLDQLTSEQKRLAAYKFRFASPSKKAEEQRSISAQQPTALHRGRNLSK